MTEVERLKNQIKELKRERDDWKRASQYNAETIRILAERVKVSTGTGDADADT